MSIVNAVPKFRHSRGVLYLETLYCSRGTEGLNELAAAIDMSLL